MICVNEVLISGRELGVEKQCQHVLAAFRKTCELTRLSSSVRSGRGRSERCSGLESVWIQGVGIISSILFAPPQLDDGPRPLPTIHLQASSSFRFFSSPSRSQPILTL